MRKTPLFACALLVAAGCGSTDAIGPGDDGPLPAFGSMSARIEGDSWRAIEPDGLLRRGVLAIRGVDLTGVLIEIEVPLDGIGTYPIRSFSLTRALVSTGFARWRAVDGFGDGVVTVTTLTAGRATGSFSFTAKPVGYASLERTSLLVTNGRFDVTF